MLGVHGPGTESGHLVHVHHLGHLGEFEHLDLLDLVGGTESVEEMQEGHAGLNGRQVSHQGHVMGFLDGASGQHGESGLAAGHHVLVVAEDGQGVCGDGAGGHMEDSRQQLAGDLVHVGDHEQQALRGCIRAGERPGGQATVHGAGGSGLGLQFTDLHALAEDVLHALRGPFVDHLAHVGRGSDGIDGRAFGQSVGHPRGGGVSVHCLDQFLCHWLASFLCSVCGLTRNQVPAGWSPCPDGRPPVGMLV